MIKLMITMQILSVSFFFLFSMTHVYAENSKLPPEKNRIKPDHAPTPFNAEEIMVGCPEGRTIIYRIEMKDKPLQFQKIEFSNSKKDGADFVTTGVDEKGKEISEKQVSRSTWAEFQSHASFPQALTNIGIDKYTTPLGTFDCWLYIVKSDTIMRFWFAKKFPGPPLQMEVEQNGVIVNKMTMISNSTL